MRKIRYFCLTLCFLLLFSVTAFGRTEGYVFDEAGLYSQEEAAELSARAQKIGQDWGLDVLFLTTEDTGGLSAREYAAQFFIDGDFGLGEDQSGIVFIIDMGGRDAQMVTAGTAIDIFTDYYIDGIWNKVKPYLSDGKYYEAMSLFLDDVAYYCGEYQQYLSDPDGYVSEYQMAKADNTMLLCMGVAFVLSIVIAGLSVASMKRSHNNVRPYTDGRAYLKENGLRMDIDRDSFVSTHTIRTEIPKNNNHGGSSWGGGSSTFSHGGRSFGGGGGKF